METVTRGSWYGYTRASPACAALAASLSSVHAASISPPAACLLLPSPSPPLLLSAAAFKPAVACAPDSLPPLEEEREAPPLEDDGTFG